jgi:hypothetical protein
MLSNISLISPISAPNTEKYMTGQVAATLHHEVKHIVDEKRETVEEKTVEATV